MPLDKAGPPLQNREHTASIAHMLPFHPRTKQLDDDSEASTPVPAVDGSINLHAEVALLALRIPCKGVTVTRLVLRAKWAVAYSP